MITVTDTEGTEIGALRHVSDPDTRADAYSAAVLTPDGTGYLPVTPATGDGEYFTTREAAETAIRTTHAAPSAHHAPAAVSGDDTPMTAEEAIAHFESMGFEIVGNDEIRIID